MRCRQPEKILFPPELWVFLVETGQFSPLLACQLTLLRMAKVPAIDSSPSHSLGKPADGNSKSLGDSPAAEALTEAELYGLLPLLCRELAS